MNMMNKSNVISMTKKSFYNSFRIFIDDLRSENTKKNYYRNIMMFLSWHHSTTGKSISEIQPEDLKIINEDIKAYRLYLKEHPVEYSNNTINSMIAAVQSLYSFLETNDYPVKAANVSLDSLPTDPKTAGDLTLPEAEKMAKLVESVETKRANKAFEKATLIRTAYTTSFRKQSLLNLEWRDIELSSVPGVYTVKLRALNAKNGKTHSVFISEELWADLLKLKMSRPEDTLNSKIFQLNKNTILDMMKWLRKEMNIPEERNIVFHSFRNVAAMYGSLEEAKDHYNHSSITVTEKSYRHHHIDISKSLSLRMKEEVSDDIFSEMTKEQLVELLLQQESGVKYKLKNDARNILLNKH